MPLFISLFLIVRFSLFLGEADVVIRSELSWARRSDARLRHGLIELRFDREVLSFQHFDWCFAQRCFLSIWRMRPDGRLFPRHKTSRGQDVSVYWSSTNSYLLILVTQLEQKYWWLKHCQMKERFFATRIYKLSITSRSSFSLASKKVRSTLIADHSSYVKEPVLWASAFESWLMDATGSVKNVFPHKNRIETRIIITADDTYLRNV